MLLAIHVRVVFDDELCILSAYLSRDVFLCSFFFFFQAEDGIRDLVRSRGLGDVYKRQDLRFFLTKLNQELPDSDLFLFAHSTGGLVTAYVPVSYTHLTLPTSDLG